MFSAKSLSEDQVSQIHAWAEEGDDLAALQKKINEELEVKVTYMETRFLVDDLKVEIKSPEPEPEPDSEETVEDELAGTLPLQGDPNAVTVSIAKVQRPGTMISGTAMFGGVETVEWWMDNMGQLGMSPSNPEFKPTQQQQQAFQMELQAAASREGL